MFKSPLWSNPIDKKRTVLTEEGKKRIWGNTPEGYKVLDYVLFHTWPQYRKEFIPFPDRKQYLRQINYGTLVFDKNGRKYYTFSHIYKKLGITKRLLEIWIQNEVLPPFLYLTPKGKRCVSEDQLQAITYIFNKCKKERIKNKWDRMRRYLYPRWVKIEEKARGISWTDRNKDKN